MNEPRDEWVPFGTVSRAHGIRGEIRLVPHHPEDPLPASVTELGLGDGDDVRVVRLTGARATSGALLIRLEGITDRDAAQALSRTPVLIRQRDLPALEEGEFYLFELEGCQVFDEAGASLGRVQHVQTNPAQDLLVIASPAGERLLPLVPETVVSFERAANRLVVSVAEGLWDADEVGPSGESGR